MSTMGATTEEKRTPTPWKVIGKQTIRAVNDATDYDLIAKTHWNNGEANAAHIVHCVNSFDALTEANRELHAKLDTAADFAFSRDKELLALTEANKKLVAAVEFERGSAERLAQWNEKLCEEVTALTEANARQKAAIESAIRRLDDWGFMNSKSVAEDIADTLRDAIVVPK